MQILKTSAKLAIMGAIMLIIRPAHASPPAPSLRPLIIAHQGGDGIRPSNTMAAFQNAVDLGVDMLEMDIHSTQDGVLVTIHDSTIDRTTDGTGRIQDYTYAELQAFDAAYHWPTLAVEEGREVEEYTYRGTGVTIAALEDVFAAFPDMPMNIEIKQGEPSIAQDFCDLIHQYEMADKVLVASFSNETMTDFRQTCPDVATSATQDEVRQFFSLNLGGRLDEFDSPATALQVPEMFGSIPLLTPEFIAAAHEKGMEVHVWTVNTTEDLERIAALGVDGIITDYPDRLLEIIGPAPEDE